MIWLKIIKNYEKNRYIINKFLGDAKEYKSAPVPAHAYKPAPAYKPLAPVYNKPVVTYKPSDSYNPAPAYKPTYKPGMYIRKLNALKL